YYETPLSAPTQQAYSATLRHLFVPRYRVWGAHNWQTVTDDNLAEHIATLYSDRPLILFGDDDDNIPSTISQPSFVLRMLDMLQIEPGQTIFELGAGSGWNAALMGRLVGLGGHVYSIEIIPEVARRAAETIESVGIGNVSIINADGGAGYLPGAPYDRAIFTAGAYDLPHHFYDQMKDDGLLVIVIKNEGGGDNLFLLRKRADHFESLLALPCGFVQLTGKYQIKRLEPIVIEHLQEWAELQQREIIRQPFWWGGKGKAGFLRHTMGIRSFLGITEPSFRAFKTVKDMQHMRQEQYFGLWDSEAQSLVLAKDDCLIAYGNSVAHARLLQKVGQWVDLGMPSAASFQLRVYPSSAQVPVGDKQWRVERHESQFLWSLAAEPQADALQLPEAN
ncbi:MAG: protein-L-isoaspartate O-methyltransferase, partial [Chloroflexota bacterium]|nr:protein-L-isoaspartate O-methyltransferase [Chloroflexota bacterium]